MRHRINKGRKLNRTSGHRQALLRNLLTSLVDKGKIETTIAKAKELKSFSEKTIASAQRANLSTRRKLFSLITKKEVAEKLFHEILPSFEGRTSGFTRVIKLGQRLSDGSERARIELVKKKDENKNNQ